MQCGESECNRMNDDSSSSKVSVWTVIFATDFSLSSQNAGLYASFLARRFGADLIVAHAFHLSQAALEMEFGSELKSRQRLDLEAFLTRSAARLGGARVQSIPTLVDGDPRDAISHIAEEHEGSIVVLGTHGGSVVSRWVLGSVAEGILRSACCPCLTVGPKVPALDVEAEHFKRILYATELDRSATRATEYAVTIAEEFNAEIDVLHVVHPDEIKHPESFEEIQNEFYSALDQLIPSQAKALCTTRSFVEVGNAHAQILEHIKEFSVDLLVLGVRKSNHTWIDSTSSGAFSIIAQAPCPVLIVAD